MNTLITGGMGFIGINLIRGLLSTQNRKIYVIDRKPETITSNRVMLVHEDLTKYTPDSNIENLSAVVLLASISGRNLDDKDNVFEFNVASNVQLIQKVLDKGHEGFKVIIPSSQLVYEGSKRSEETLDYSPESIYAMSKLELEKQLMELSEETKRFSVTSFRITNPFGSHVPVKQNYNYTNQMLYDLFCDKEISLYKHGEILKNYLPIQNLVRVFIQTIDDNLFRSEIVNLGHYEDVLIKDFFEMAREVFNRGKVNLIESGNDTYEHIDTAKLYSTVEKKSLLSLKGALVEFKEFFEKKKDPKIENFI